MKGKQLLNISLITLLAMSIVTILGPTSVFGATADACYIVPANVLKVATSECQFNNTVFTVEVIGENFVDVAGFQIVITYNSSLLALDSITADTDPANPMSPTQMAPDSDDRVDTDNSVAGTIQLAVVWKTATPTYTYSGNSTMAEITFRIIYCPSPQPIEPALPLVVSCALDSSDTLTKLVDGLGDDELFTNVYDGYYQYTLLAKTPGQPIPDFVWSPPFPNPSDVVTLTDISDPVGDGDFITAWQWEISGVGTLLTPMVNTVSFDYYVCAGYNVTPTPPAPAPDPAGFDVTFYSMANQTPALTPAPVYDFGSIDLWGGRTYLFSGVESAAGLMGAALDIQNLLGYDITILDLTVEVSASTPVPDQSSNASMVMVDTLDQWEITSGRYDEVDYTPGNETVVVKRVPDYVMADPWPVDRFAIKIRDPPSYPEGPGSLVAPDYDGDAAATGHVAPIPLASGATYRDYFGPLIRSEDVNTNTSSVNPGTQIDGTLTFYLTYEAQLADTPTAEFHCDGEGAVEVTLTVWDNEEQSATITKIIEQTEPPAAEVDVWTSGNRFCGQVTTNYGKGFGVPADAISPDVNVTFYALVTWGGAPLAHRLVGFEIIDNQGQNVVTRTAETDKQGVARIWFRMPLMNPPDQIFGTWNLTVSVKIQDVKVYDYLPFKVGWVVTITGKWEDKEIYDIGNPDGSATDGDYIEVTVELKNIMMMPKEYFLAVTIYDDCDVPILKLQDSGTIDPEFPWCSPEVMNVTLVGRIPHWAYVGIGKVYANVYTAPPFDCGTPYSPEVANLIQLVWSGELFTDP